MKKFTFNFSFLDRFKKTPPQEQNPQEFHEDTEESAQFNDEDYAFKPDSEYESNESPEEFAEKTLGGFTQEQFHHQINENEENNPKEEIEHVFDDSEDELTEIKIRQFPDAPLPEKPETLRKFTFKFPQFNHQETANKIKSTLSGKAAMNTLNKFSWNDFVLRIFSPYSRGKIHSVFIILLVVTITYMFGKNIALFLSKAPPVAKVARAPQVQTENNDSTIQDINKIVSANLFNAKESDKAINNAPLKDIESIICNEADKPTALQIKLLDTIVLQDSVKSVASVQVRGNTELMNVREGERLEEMAEVSKIDRMRLILKNLQTGDCEYASSETEAEIPMPDFKILSPKKGKSLFKSMNPNIKNTGNTFKIKKNYRDSMVTNMSEILTQAKAVQITNPDGSLCFKMTEIVPGSLYSNLDIQENDIICDINGKKIENLNDLMGLLGKIKEIDQFQIGLKRNGMTENKEYGFE